MIRIQKSDSESRDIFSSIEKVPTSFSNDFIINIFIYFDIYNILVLLADAQYMMSD